MAASGEPLAAKDDDAGLNAGKGAGDLDKVGIAKLAAELGGLVTPGNTEQVQGVDVPKSDVGQLILDLIRDQIGILHLRDGGKNDVVFLRALDGVLQFVAIDGQIDHCAHSI